MLVLLLKSTSALRLLNNRLRASGTDHIGIGRLRNSRPLLRRLPSLSIYQNNNRAFGSICNTFSTSTSIPTRDLPSLNLYSGVVKSYPFAAIHDKSCSFVGRSGLWTPYTSLILASTFIS